MKALNCGFLQGAIHPLHLAVSPGVGRLGEALLNSSLVAELPYRMATYLSMMRQIAKLNTIVCQ